MVVMVLYQQTTELVRLGSMRHRNFNKKTHFIEWETPHCWINGMVCFLYVCMCVCGGFGLVDNPLLILPLGLPYSGFKRTSQTLAGTPVKYQSLVNLRVDSLYAGISYRLEARACSLRLSWNRDPVIHLTFSSL